MRDGEPHPFAILPGSWFSITCWESWNLPGYNGTHYLFRTQISLNRHSGLFRNLLIFLKDFPKVYHFCFLLHNVQRSILMLHRWIDFQELLRSDLPDMCPGLRKNLQLPLVLQTYQSFPNICPWNSEALDDLFLIQFRVKDAPKQWHSEETGKSVERSTSNDLGWNHRARL